MDAPHNYNEWLDQARRFDSLRGYDRWRQEDSSSLYDYASIRSRLTRLKKLRLARDNAGLLFELSEGIHGNMDGMGNQALYRRSRVGTKKLVTDYVDAVVDALETLARSTSDGIPFEEKLDFFRRASHCYGRSALMFSGGGVLGYFHLGVVRALLEHDLLPAVVSGSSAGSIIAAILGSHPEDELLEFFDSDDLVLEAEKEAHWITRWIWGGNTQMDVTGQQRLINRWIPDLTFREAFELTGRHINIPVAPARMHQSSRLLNAITAPEVCLRSAVMASCAVPGVFPPVTLKARDFEGRRIDYLPSRQWIDGSITGDLPAKRLGRLYGVNHFIVSQINPAVLPFLKDSGTESGLLDAPVRVAAATLRESLHVFKGLSKRLFSPLPRLNVLLDMFYSVALQDYTGDINILPSFRFYNPTKILAHPLEEDVQRLIAEGERAAWPKVAQIKTCTAISRKLDEILLDYDDMALREAVPRAVKAS
ncbi:MAG: DUF3336 domain-containing protein [Pseudomonadota bacterium]